MQYIAQSIQYFKYLNRLDTIFFSIAANLGVSIFLCQYILIKSNALVKESFFSVSTYLLKLML